MGKLQHTLIQKTLVLASLWLLSACGPTAFQALDVNQVFDGPGQYSIPPKVDILLAQDDTGSLISTLDDVTRQFPGFLNQLENQGWDYRFAVTPLTQARPVTQAMTSKFDTNWFFNGSGLWQSPIIGITPQQVTGALDATIFRRPQDFTAFLAPQQIIRENQQCEPGFLTIRDVLSASTAFRRADAVTAVIVVGNGNDNSWVNFCNRGDGKVEPCESSPNADAPLSLTATSINTTTDVLTINPLVPYITGQEVKFTPVASSLLPNPLVAGTTYYVIALSPTSIKLALTRADATSAIAIDLITRGSGTFSLSVPQTLASSFNYFKEKFKYLSAQFRFYPAIAFSQSTTCPSDGAGGGGTSYVGYRYADMASNTNGVGGKAFDICTQPISAVLSGIAGDLQVQRFNYRRRFLVLPEEPAMPGDEGFEFFAITKYPNGDTNQPGIALQNSDTNGWTYLGGPQTVFTVDFPVPLFSATGYIIELHGDAKLVGSDSVRIEYKPKGTQNSSG